MSDAMCDSYYEEDSRQWLRAIQRAVDAWEYKAALEMADIAPRVTHGKYQWTKEYVAQVKESIFRRIRGVRPT